jgi:SAM-dependent methyltransferase/ADP-ribose pyrophosphatase YjhB (NUDIX family)
VRPQDLSAASVYYRHPDFFEEATTPDPASLAAVLARYGLRQPSSVLDLGCATGALLADLKAPIRVGVDLLPAMIAHGQALRPELDLRVGDLRTVLLHRQFDLVTCLGATLSYLHHDEDLESACAVLAAHAAHGGLVVIQTPTAPMPSLAPVTFATRLYGGPATTTVAYQWDDPILTTHRIHRLADGTQVRDQVPRRIWTVPDLHTALARNGLRPIDDGVYVTATRRTDQPTVARRSVRAALLTTDNRLLVIRRTQPGQTPYLTAIGGEVEHDDHDLATTARRAVREELGIAIGTDITPVTTLVAPEGDRGAHVQHVLAARITGSDLTARDIALAAKEQPVTIPLTPKSLSASGLRPVALAAHLAANTQRIIDRLHAGS